MVSSKKIHCVICNKKCSGNVLRYQDQYYHKQCFELEQSEGKRQELYPDSAPHSDDSIYHADDSHSHTQIFNNNTTNNNNNNNNNNNSNSNSNNTVNINQHSVSNSLGQITPKSQQLGANNNHLPAARSSSMLKTRHRGDRENSNMTANRAATLPHSTSSPANGFLSVAPNTRLQLTKCAGCGDKISDGQALIALDLHWHVWCFKCSQCKTALHGEYVAKDGKAYCEKDYQKLFGVTCVYCKRYITGKVLQAGEAHHFHPSCARCSKCGDPFVPGEEMYLQGEVTWHPRCGPGPDPTATPIDELALDASGRMQLCASRAQSPSLSSRSRSRSASPFSFMSRQLGRSSPGYADSEAVGDLSRIYTISYLNADPTQGYLRRPIEPNPAKSPQFSRPAGFGQARDARSRSSSRSQYYTSGTSANRDRSVPRGMYSVLSGMRSGSSHRARSPSMLNEEAIHLAQYPSGQKPSPDTVPKIERDDFPAPPFPYPDRPRGGSSSQLGGQSGAAATVQEEPVVRHQPKHQLQQRESRPRSRELVIDDDESSGDDPQLKKEEEELSKIANGIGKIFLSTLKEREKLRAWKRANLDPRNASRTPSATRELPSRLRYHNPTNASPSRDMDRPRPWEEEEPADHSPTRTRSSLGRPGQMSPASYGYKVIQSNRSTPKPGYGLTNGNCISANTNGGYQNSDMSFSQNQRNIQNRSTDLLSRATLHSEPKGRTFGSPHLRRSMPNVNSLHHIHQEGPPKLYPYHLLATSNYRLPPDVDRCHLERHLANEEFQYIFHCDRLDFYRLPEWKRNELKRRAKLF